MHTEKMLPLFPSPPVGGRIALAKKQLNARPPPLSKSATFHDTKVSTGNFL